MRPGPFSDFGQGRQFLGGPCTRHPVMYGHQRRKTTLLDEGHANSRREAIAILRKLAATICMPLVKEGRLTALMAIHDRVPRAWTSKDVDLTEVTERSWAHIERVRLIQDLRNSETRYRGAVITGRIAAWETDMVTRTRIWTDEGMELFGLDCRAAAARWVARTTNFWALYTPMTNT